MRFMASSALFAVALLSATVALGDDPDPKSIVAAVDKAAKAVNAVSYEAKSWGEGVLEKKTPRLEARVVARAGKTGDLDALRIDGVMSGDGKTPFIMVMDEKRVLALDPTEKSGTVGDLPEAAKLIEQPLGLLLMREFVYPKPYSDELGADALKYEGERDVNGVRCHVIHVVYEGGKVAARWYFGLDDNLPHRVDRIYKTEQGEGVRVLELSKLNTSPKIDDATFATKAPAGFEIKQLEPPAKKAKKSKKPRKPASGLLAVGDEAPDWTLKTSDGKDVTLSKLRGKIVVLDFWATWCGPCKAAMPSVQKLHEHFKGKPVEVFGVDIWESPKGDPAGYMKKKGFTYTLLMKADKIGKPYGINGIPTFYIIGTDGRVLHASTGFHAGGMGELQKLIEDALSKGD